MARQRLLIFVVLAVAVLALPCGMDRAYAADGGAAGRAALAAAGETAAVTDTWYANSPQPNPNNGQGAIPLVSGTPIRKFVSGLPGLGPANANTNGKYIPIAKPVANPLYPNDDFYEIGLVEYTQQLHPDLAKPTKLRGYVDMSGGPPASLTNQSFFLGPVIVAQRNRAVRILFQNRLPTGQPGNLFLPVDPTIMGAGIGPDGIHSYSQNRADIHLHGGFTPWISDGTPHQWITPLGQAGPYFPKPTNPYYNFKGVSFQNVPDMVGLVGRPIPTPTATDGLATYYYPNKQSGRLMFFHDHAYGITRLNVYVGEAAGYLLHDPVEDGLISSGVIPTGGGAFSPATNPHSWGIPLVIQDKTFVPNDVAIQDKAWGDNTGIPAGATPNWGVPGDLWFPHKYEPNQDPTSDLMAPACSGGGITAPGSGRRSRLSLPLPGEALDLSNPWVYSASHVPEAFMDTPMVNGNPYPYLDVQPQAYRFRLLNACNDRNLNLSMFVADVGGGGSGATCYRNGASVSRSRLPASSLGPRASGYTSAPSVYITGGGGTGATATATLPPQPVASITADQRRHRLYHCSDGHHHGWRGCYHPALLPPLPSTNGSVTGITITNAGAGYTDAPLVSLTGGGGFGATAMAALTAGPIAAITLTNGGAGYTSAPTVTIGSATEVKMVPAVPTAGFPATWPTDGRDGGVPDPATAGPNMIQIGTEGGFLPAPVVLPNQPVDYDYNRRNIVVLNVLDKALFLGPAERADVIVDFSAVCR